MKPAGDGRMPTGSSKLDFIPIAWQQHILRMKAQGKPNDEIAYELKRKYNYKVNKVTIGKWLRTRTDAAPSILFKRESYVNELESNYVEMLRDFRKLSEFTWKYLKELHESSKKGDTKARGDTLKTIAELRSQIELANSLMGTLPKTNEQIEDTAKSVGKALSELNKMGLIKQFNEAKTASEDEEKKRIENSPLKRDMDLELEDADGEKILITKKVGIDLASYQ
jgi:hypothetical protein